LLKIYYTVFSIPGKVIEGGLSAKENDEKLFLDRNIQRNFRKGRTNGYE